MADKEVKILVSTDAELSEVESLDELVEKIKENAAEVKIHADIAELQSAFEEANSEVERLRDELAAIEMGESAADFDEVAASLAEAEAEAERLSDALSSLDGANVGGISGDFDEVGASADSATTEIDELQSSMDLLNAQALMGIAGELGSLGSEAENMAQGMNTAAITVGQLATQTGIAEPQMVSLINNISNATFPNDEAMMYVKSLDQIGVASGNLGKSATDLDRINDAFGLGANTVNSLGQELSVLGVDMNNVSSAFNALAYANANTVGGMENYYSFLKKYDAEFNELGYNVDQASIIIAGATQKFGGGRAALSGLSNALKEANGDSRKLEEALGLQAGALDNASAITGQYEGQLQALADEEAEHKTWLDQINAAWEDFSLAMSPVLSPMASFMGIIGQAGSWAVGVNGLIQLGQHFRELEMVQTLIGKLNGLKTALISVGASAKSAVVGIANFAKTLITTAAGAIKSAVVSLASLAKNVLLAGANALKSAALWAIQKAALIASTIAEYGLAAAQAILNAVMAMNPIMLVVIALAALVAALVWAYYNVDWFREMVDNAWQSIVQFAQYIYGSLVGALDWLGQAFNNAGQIMMSTITNAVNWVMLTLQNLWNYIMTLGGLIPANAEITGNKVIDSVLKFLAFMGTLPMQLGIIFVNAIAKALGFGNNFAQNMLNAGSRALSNFLGQIGQMYNGLKTELNNMLSAVGEWASTLPQKFWDAGVNAVKNFLSALGIASPGTMQRMMVWEVSEMARRVPIEGKGLTQSLSQLGTDAVDSFGKPKLELGFTSDKDFANGSIQTLVNYISGNGGGDTNINIYGDIDEEAKMKRFAEYIRRDMNFNNRTANRRV